MARRASFFDGGAGKGGKQVNSKGSVRMICDSCGKKTIVSKNALFRAGRIACSACGGSTCLSELGTKKVLGSSKKATPVIRICKTCSCKLRSGNKTSLCALCQEKEWRGLL